MADNRELGLRVGAAYNQASGVATALVQNGRLPDDPTVVATYVEELASELLGKMETTQAALAVGAAFAGTQIAASSFPANPAPADQSTYGAIPTPAHAVPTDEHTFSGSSRPLKLAEHPELPGWLHTQATAKGVSEVWDNRGKANYIAAIQSGASKTPPPFRSATAGNDTSFWPPK